MLFCCCFCRNQVAARRGEALASNKRQRDVPRNVGSVCVLLAYFGATHHHQPSAHHSPPSSVSPPAVIQPTVVSQPVSPPLTTIIASPPLTTIVRSPTRQPVNSSVATTIDTTIVSQSTRQLSPLSIPPLKGRDQHRCPNF